MVACCVRTPRCHFRVMSAPAFWSDCEEADDLPCTSCLLENPMVSRGSMMTKAVSPGDSCSVNLMAVKRYMKEHVTHYALVAMQLLC